MKRKKERKRRCSHVETIFLCVNRNETIWCGRIHLFFPSPFETLVGTAHAITKEAKKKKKKKGISSSSSGSVLLSRLFFLWCSIRITWIWKISHPFILCVLSFHLCFCLLFVVLVVVVLYWLAQIKRKNFQVSFSSSSCSLVGTVTRLIRSRLLRSRGPHTFCVVGRKTKQNGEKENLCVKERNAHISHWSWVMCLYALGRRRLFFYIIHPWRSLRFIFVFFSFLIFIYYSSMPQRSFLSLSPAVPSPLYSLDRIYLFLPITARQSISSLIYVDIVWIIALPQTLQTNV